MVRPFSFSLTEKRLRRAGLDYIQNVTITEVDKLPLEGDFYLFSTKGERLYSEIEYPKDAKLIFGPESKGLPTTLLDEHPDRVVTLPMLPGNRSLNLSNAVAIAAYHAWQTQNFVGSRAL